MRASTRRTGHTDAGRKMMMSARTRNASASLPTTTRASADADAPTYTKIFDATTGQDVEVLWQSVHAVDVGDGATWSYRKGVPAEDCATLKSTKIVFAHGLGACAYTFRNVQRALQERGFTSYAFDATGHGDSSKPAPGRGVAGYDAAATGAALEGFLTATGLASEPVDLVMHGFVIPQHVLLYMAKNPKKFRRVVLMNTPLTNAHAYPPQMATFTRPFGMGKGAAFDAAGYLYNGNEFALPGEVLEEYEKPYSGAQAEAARAAAEAYVTKCDLKKVSKQVIDALQSRGLPKIRVIWGTADRYLDDATIYDWCSDVRASFSAMRKVGHMPQEDFVDETAARIADFLDSDLKVSALSSVRVGKITSDDGQG